MPVEYKIFPEHRLLITWPKGLVTGQELIDVYETIFQDPQCHPSFGELADLRQATTFDVSTGDFQLLSDMTMVFQGDTVAHTAVLVDRPMNEIISRLYQSVAEAGGAEIVRQFAELTDALEWLGVPGFDPALLKAEF